jgi:2-polyprenyl-3-methyl-5-hydroxy-6-metoxy-1,4-benzoquinol methylase
MKKNSVEQHYDASAENYNLQYERDLISDLTRSYPANYFRLHLLLKSFIEKDIKRVVEVGVGEGTPLVTLANTGIEVAGFDISKKMIDKCQHNFKKNKLSDRQIIWGDIQDPITYAPLLSDGQYDALLAMGVMPHVRNDDFTLNNMKSMIKPGGHVFIEFRNKLFSLFTFNRYTFEFIMDDLLRDVSPKIKDIVGNHLKAKLEMDKPEKRLKIGSKNIDDVNKNTDVPGYDAILSKFHNPFEVLTQFDRLGFEEAKLLWYHYHPAMPYLNNKDAELFREEALKLEHETSGWRGLFLCSAFVVEAKKTENG